MEKPWASARSCEPRVRRASWLIGTICVVLGCPSAHCPSELGRFSRAVWCSQGHRPPHTNHHRGAGGGVEALKPNPQSLPAAGSPLPSALNAPSLSKQALFFLAKKTKVGIKCFEGESLPRSPRLLPLGWARDCRGAQKAYWEVSLKLSGPLVPGPSCHLLYQPDPLALWSHSSGIQLPPPSNLWVPVQPEMGTLPLPVSYSIKQSRLSLSGGLSYRHWRRLTASTQPCQGTWVPGTTKDLAWDKKNSCKGHLPAPWRPWAKTQGVWTTIPEGSPDLGSFSCWVSIRVTCFQ